MIKHILFGISLIFSINLLASEELFKLNSLAPSSEFKKDKSSESLPPLEKIGGINGFLEIRNKVIHNYNSLDSKKFSFLGTLREPTKNHRKKIDKKRKCLT